MVGSPSPEGQADRLRCGAQGLGMELTDSQVERLLGYLRLLSQWSHTYNLTAVRDPAEMLPRHLLDSLSVRRYLFGERVLDLGTGAGLPGFPLAICEPDRHFALLDGNGKKIRFVRQAAMELGLSNLEAAHCRIESYRPGHKFSTIACRAVSAIHEIHALAAPLLEAPGRLLVMKGRYPAEELQNPALADLDLAIYPLQVPFLEGERHLIEIRRE
jgi:16S rRNA (guanine527-N7)-methyltransferase